MNDQKDKGGQAFPSTSYTTMYPCNADGSQAQTYQEEEHVPGMTLRDYFAAAAIQGLLASIGEDESITAGNAAAFAIKCADAMIEERNR